MAAARQNEMNERRTVVATTTRRRRHGRAYPGAGQTIVNDTTASGLFGAAPRVLPDGSAAAFARAADVAVLIPPSYLNANRRPHEPELLPQLVDEKPFIREMKRRRDVGEEDE